MIYQKDRQYSLVIGQGKGSGVEINNLHITFRVSKSSDNKKNPAKANISIYNLSEEYQRYVEEPFVEVVLSVGYGGAGMKRLFAGQVTIAGTEKRGTDIITELQIDSLYTELNHKVVSKTLQTGTTIRKVIETVVEQMEGVSRVVFAGNTINTQFVDGYSITQSPRQVLNDLASAYEIEWQVDDGVLYVNDRAKSYMTNNSKAFVISETSGMIERPYFDNIEKQRGKKDKVKAKRKGVKVKILLNPALTAGSIVKMEYAEFTGFYKIERLTHHGEYYGESWYSDLVLGTMLK